MHDGQKPRPLQLNATSRWETVRREQKGPLPLDARLERARGSLYHGRVRTGPQEGERIEGVASGGSATDPRPGASSGRWGSRLAPPSGDRRMLACLPWPAASEDAARQTSPCPAQLADQRHLDRGLLRHRLLRRAARAEHLPPQQRGAAHRLLPGRPPLRER